MRSYVSYIGSHAQNQTAIFSKLSKLPSSLLNETVCRLTTQQSANIDTQQSANIDTQQSADIDTRQSANTDASFRGFWFTLGLRVSCFVVSAFSKNKRRHHFLHPLFLANLANIPFEALICGKKGNPKLDCV